MQKANNQEIEPDLPCPGKDLLLALQKGDTDPVVPQIVEVQTGGTRVMTTI